MYKHYLRLDKDNYIIKSFSDAFEQPIDGDVLFQESESRQFYTDELGYNPDLCDYKYLNGKFVYTPKPVIIIPVVDPFQKLELAIQMQDFRIDLLDYKVSTGGGN